MAQVNDYLCDVCGRWCSSVEVEGKPVPLVVYIAAGTPPDYAGPPVNLNEPGLKLPAIVREIMAQPIARREFCVECFAKALGLELVEAVRRPPKVAPGS